MNDTQVSHLSTHPNLQYREEKDLKQVLMMNIAKASSLCYRQGDLTQSKDKGRPP